MEDRRRKTLTALDTLRHGRNTHPSCCACGAGACQQLRPCHAHLERRDVPSRRGLRLPLVAVVDDAAALGLDADGDLPEARASHRVAHRLVPTPRREEQEAAAPAGACDLAPGRPGLEGGAVDGVQVAVRHVRRHLLLQLPALVEEAADPVDMPRQHRPAQVRRDGDEAVDHRQAVRPRRQPRPRLAEDAARVAVNARVEEQQPVHEPLSQVGGADERMHAHRAIGEEPDILQSPVGRDVLVLPADRLAEDFGLDLASLAREFGRRSPGALHRVERVQHADRQRRARSQADPGRQVGDRGDLEAAREARQFHALADQVVLQIVNAIDDLGPGVGNTNAAVEPLVNGDVHVVVDRHRHDVAGPLSVVFGKVGTAARQAHAERGA